ncbi:spike base protein, RCAP_Rcc01079 family [Palleronia caenipelagi]|uniref:Uncharacterized protein n=1 Tax=Palleronia caenipelagi TaxID=2489174 RepID=A0A547Q0D2_9RHOB|nr:hypothetical protein [Palleronia caenipelagi]TRD19819.1 hypothetical protein FEV53_10265 [Palleronia caenipelagi]
MTDRFKDYSSGLESPATELIEITPDDSAVLPVCVRGLNVAQSGSVRVETVGGSLATIYVVAGGAFPVRVARVLATGTTATGIVGMI